MTPHDPFDPYSPPKAPLPTFDVDVATKPDDDGSPEWATVATFDDSTGALHAVRLLEVALIDSRVVDEGGGPHLVQVSPSNLVEAAKTLGVTVDPNAPLPEYVSPGDARMRQALIVSVLGTLFCPGGSHVGSLIAVMLTPASDLSPKGLRVRRWAIAIDLMVLAALLALPCVTR
jgi:hypothetical protein